MLKEELYSGYEFYWFTYRDKTIINVLHFEMQPFYIA